MSDQPTVSVTLTYEAAANIRALVLDRFREDDRVEQAVREEFTLERWEEVKHIYQMQPSTRDGYESFLDQIHERWPEEFDGK